MMVLSPAAMVSDPDINLPGDGITDFQVTIAKDVITEVWISKGVARLGIEVAWN